jgi:hypothetical protein
VGRIETPFVYEMKAEEENEFKKRRRVERKYKSKVLNGQIRKLHLSTEKLTDNFEAP